jgi:hypothetical protein
MDAGLTVPPAWDDPEGSAFIPVPARQPANMTTQTVDATKERLPIIDASQLR